MASNIIGNRNSTPEASKPTLRPPVASRNLANYTQNAQLRASADVSGFSSSPVASRAIRPSSEVYYGQPGTLNSQDDVERAAQQWLSDIDQFETTLEEMAVATLDQDFKDELSAIEQWFRVLSEAERTSALYALLRQTTQVQIRFFIQVLQQMSKNHPMSGMLSPNNFGEKDPMSNRLSDAMSKLNVEGNRNSFARPPPSPGAKRNSGLDPSTINAMFPDAAAAIAQQKAEFTQHTGNVPTSNRNSAAFPGDRSSLVAPTISTPGDNIKEPSAAAASSNWRSNDQAPISRPKSSGQQQQQIPPPMGQFSQPLPSAGLRSPHPFQQAESSNIQTTTLNAPSNMDLPMLSPYNINASWASMSNTPMVPTFNHAQQNNQAEMVANATAMKLAALSTVNNRIPLDDARKYRRARSNDGQGRNGQQPPVSPGMINNMNMLNHDANNAYLNPLSAQPLTTQQLMALQAQQQASLLGSRSRPNSPGISLQNNVLASMSYLSPQGHMFDSRNQPRSPSRGGDGYLSDRTRGRSPANRSASKAPGEEHLNPKLLKDIPAWLVAMRLKKYVEPFEKKGVTWDIMVDMDAKDLEQMGVSTDGARNKLLRLFAQINDAYPNKKLPNDK